MYQLDEIVPGLYLSDAQAASSLETLQHFKITHVLVVGDELTRHFPESIQYKQLPIQDTLTFKILPFFAESNQFIEQALRSKCNVLVHCAMGISRSATLVIAFVMSASGLSYEKVNKLVKRKHRTSNPNSKFAEQLQLYERQLQRPGQCCCRLQ
jgi:protein-tyrosine phosphatase